MVRTIHLIANRPSFQYFFCLQVCKLTLVASFKVYDYYYYDYYDYDYDYDCDCDCDYDDDAADDDDYYYYLIFSLRPRQQGVICKQTKEH